MAVRSADDRGGIDPGRRIRIDAGLILIAVIWGLNFPIMKFAIQATSPMAVNALRFPLAAATITLMLRLQGRRLLPLRKDWPLIVLLGIVGHVLFQLLFIFALDLTSTGNSALLLSTAPVWIILVAAATGRERFRPTALLGSVITLAGMVFLVAGGSDEFGGSRVGDLLMVGAAINWAVYTVVGHAPIKRHGALEVTGWALWVGTPCIFLAGLPDLLRIGFGNIPVSIWAAAMYSGVMAVAVAYLLWYRAVGAIGQSRTGVYQNLVPVVAMLVAWSWLGETPTGLQIVGTAVILAGLVVARRNPKGGRRRAVATGAKGPARPPRKRARKGR